MEYVLCLSMSRFGAPFLWLPTSIHVHQIHSENQLSWFHLLANTSTACLKFEVTKTMHCMFAAAKKYKTNATPSLRFNVFLIFLSLSQPLRTCLEALHCHCKFVITIRYIATDWREGKTNIQSTHNISKVKLQQLHVFATEQHAAAIRICQYFVGFRAPGFRWTWKNDQTVQSFDKSSKSHG